MTTLYLTIIVMLLAISIIAAIYIAILRGSVQRAKEKIKKYDAAMDQAIKVNEMLKKNIFTISEMIKKRKGTIDELEKKIENIKVPDAIDLDTMAHRFGSL